MNLSVVAEFELEIHEWEIVCRSFVFYKKITKFLFIPNEMCNFLNLQI